MTRLERKEAELAKLYEYRKIAMEQNNFYVMSRCQDKIDALAKEVEELRRHQTATVFSVLKDKGEDAKNEVYKALLRISLMADACNQACVMAREILKKYEITDFSFRKNIDALCDLSADIANVTIRTKNKTMEDFIVDNDTFVDMCIKHADAHLKRKLKI